MSEPRLNNLMDRLGHIAAVLGRSHTLSHSHLIEQLRELAAAANKWAAALESEQAAPKERLSSQRFLDE